MNKEKKQAYKSAKKRYRHRTIERRKLDAKIEKSQLFTARKERAQDFHRTHLQKGGFPRLVRFRDLLAPQKEIASHFGISQETVRYWMAEIFEENYDPRIERQEKKIAALLKILKEEGREKFEDYCKRNNINGLYKERAINQLDLQEINE